MTTALPTKLWEIRYIHPNAPRKAVLEAPTAEQALVAACLRWLPASRRDADEAAHVLEGNPEMFRVRRMP